MPSVTAVLFCWFLLLKLIISTSDSPQRTRKTFRLKPLHGLISQSTNALFQEDYYLGDIVRIVLNGDLFGTIGQVTSKADEYGEFRVQFKHSAIGLDIASMRKIPKIVIIPMQKYNEFSAVESIQSLLQTSQLNTMLLLPIEIAEHSSDKFLYVNGYLQDNSETFASGSVLLRALYAIQSREIPMNSHLEIDINSPKLMKPFRDFIKKCDPLILLPLIDESNAQSQIIIEMMNIYHSRNIDGIYFYPYRPHLLETELEWQSKNLKFMLLFNRLIYKSFDLTSLIEIVKSLLTKIQYDEENNVKNKINNIIMNVEKCLASAFHCNKVVIYAYDDYVQRIFNAMIGHYRSMTLENPISVENWVSGHVVVHSVVH